MKTSFHSTEHGFTLVEVLVASMASTIVLGALLVGGISLQKNFQSSEIFLLHQTGSNRLIDYLDLDLKNAISIAFNGEPFTSGERHLGPGDILEIRRPHFYRSNDPESLEYNVALDLASTIDASGNLGVDYGASQSLEIIVHYRYSFQQSYDSMCYVRSEAGHENVILDRAESFDCDLIMRDGGRRVEVQTWFVSPFGDGTAQINSSGLVMVRNARRDLTH